MRALLALLSLALAVSVSVTLVGGTGAVLLCAACALVVGLLTSRVEPAHRPFLLKLFVGGLLARMFIGALIYGLKLQEFFGGDALTYDYLGYYLLQSWQQGIQMPSDLKAWTVGSGWGMLYLVAGIYGVVGRNMLAVQFFNAVVGAATAPVVFHCARHIFQNVRVAKLAAVAVAFYPSIVLWSAQGLKDGPIVFVLALTMLATLKLGERLSVKYIVVLLLSMFAVQSLRFYIFYMLAAAVCGAFVIGMRPQTTQNLLRQVVIVFAMGVGFTYLGVLRSASTQLETFGNLKMMQIVRSDLARSARSGFAQDVDVSTTSGALSAIPVGAVYLMFAPFPWQLGSLRQSITLPEMIVWWASFPLLVLGAWFTVKFKLRQAMPILLFSAMITLAYSLFQGNVGTAYRQRSQLLVFYFIFVAVGAVLLKERQEESHRRVSLEKQARADAVHQAREQRRRARWQLEREARSRRQASEGGNL